LLRGRPEALNRLLAYEWPGNVRELRNVFEREAVVDQRELLKEALKHASGKAPSEHVSRAFEERVKRGDLTSVARERPGSASKQYTTPATIANERRNIEHMRPSALAKTGPLLLTRDDPA